MKKSTTVKTRTRGYVWIDTCYILDHGWKQWFLQVMKMEMYQIGWI